MSLLWSRSVSCAVLGLYAFILTVIPILHNHGCEHPDETCCEHSDPGPTIPDSDDSCLICEFAVLAVPYLMVSESLVWQPDVVSEICLTLSIPPVADVTDIPPCRAPPVI